MRIPQWIIRWRNCLFWLRRSAPLPQRSVQKVSKPNLTLKYTSCNSTWQVHVTPLDCFLLKMPYWNQGCIQGGGRPLDSLIQCPPPPCIRLWWGWIRTQDLIVSLLYPHWVEGDTSVHPWSTDTQTSSGSSWLLIHAGLLKLWMLYSAQIPSPRFRFKINSNLGAINSTSVHKSEIYLIYWE